MNNSSLLLSSPTSVKVTHAPGGNSSFSLGWESVPPRNHKPSLTLHQPEQGKPLEGYSSVPEGSFSASYVSLADSNRLLEEELLYYQRKNKMLRQNIFGGVDNLARIQQYSKRAPNFGQHWHPQGFRHGEQKFQGEQLELALQDRERQRAQERDFSGGNPSFLPKKMGNEEKSSVRVSLPPGGRSSIVFG